MPHIADQDIIAAWGQHGMAPRHMGDVYDFFFGYDIMDCIWKIYALDMPFFPRFDWLVKSTAWAQMIILKCEGRDEKP